jgi:hypothetical protein
MNLELLEWMVNKATGGKEEWYERSERYVRLAKMIQEYERYECAKLCDEGSDFCGDLIRARSND